MSVPVWIIAPVTAYCHSDGCTYPQSNVCTVPGNSQSVVGYGLYGTIIMLKGFLKKKITKSLLFSSKQTWRYILKVYGIIQAFKKTINGFETAK
jgi:hypothetical protein